MSRITNVKDTIKKNIASWPGFFGLRKGFKDRRWTGSTPVLGGEK